MSDDQTARWALPLLHAGQAQKEMFHNEALALIDMLLHGVVESADLNAPPVAPAAGQGWIVGADATGAWAGRAGAIAGWTAGGWRFATPREGLSMIVSDRGHAMIYGDGAWRDGPLRGDGLFVGNIRVVGAQAPAIADPSGGNIADVEARAALAAILTALRGHGLIAG